MTFASTLKQQFGTGHSAIRGPVHTRTFGEAKCLKEAIRALKVHFSGQADGKRCHVGVAGFFNLELVLSSRPDAVVLCDLNADQRVFWESFFDMVKESSNLTALRQAWEAGYDGGFEMSKPEEFGYLARQGWKGHPRHNRVWLRSNGPSTTFESVFFGFSFGHDEKAYADLRAMVSEGRMAAANLDLLDTKTCARLGSALKGMGYGVESIYPSNVGEFLHRETDYYQRPNGLGRKSVLQRGVFALAQGRPAMLLDTSHCKPNFTVLNR